MRNPCLASPASTRSKTPSCRKSSVVGGIKKGPWTPEEDELLSNYVNREGEGQWRTLPERAGLQRCGKSCRLRWMNYLRPSVKRGQIGSDEEDLILRLHRLLGNRWALIAGRIPGRTDNEIKNFWNTHLSKKLISQGIDPRTHKPLNPNPNTSASLLTVTSTSPNPNPNPKPKPNPNFNFCGLDHTSVINSTSEPKIQSVNPVVGNSNDENYSINSKEDGIDEEYLYNEDKFSTFLNSLINDDVFGNQQQISSSLT